MNLNFNRLELLSENIYNKITIFIPFLLSVLNNIIYHTIPNISYRQKNAGTIYFDILFMYILLYCPYTLADYKDNINIYTIIGSVITNSLFIISENAGFDFTLSNQYVWSTLEICLFTGLLLSYLLVILHHRKEYQTIYTLYYFSAILTLVTTSLIIFFADYRIKNFHLHHWIIGYTLLFLFKTNRRLGQLQAGIALGIFVHGTVTYGLDDIFT